MSNTQTVILTCILSSTLASTVIVSIKELILWFLNRRAKVEDDKKENKEEEINKILEEHKEAIERVLQAIDAVEKKLNLSLENEKIILKDKIKYLVFKYVDLGEITFEEKQAIHHMWNVYHYGLGGNGDLDDVMELLEEIPLVQKHTMKVI